MATQQIPEEVFEEVLPEPQPTSSGQSPGLFTLKNSNGAPSNKKGDTYYLIRPEGYNGEQSFTVKQCCGNELNIVIKPEHYQEVEWVATKKQRELNHVHQNNVKLIKEKQMVKEKLKMYENQVSDAKERLRELKIQLLFKLSKVATYQRKKRIEQEIRPNDVTPKEGHLSLEKKIRDLEKTYREQSEQVMGLRDNIRFTLDETVLLESHAEDLKIENKRVRDQTRNNQIILDSIQMQNAELEGKCVNYLERTAVTQAQVEELDVKAETLSRENDTIVQNNMQLADQTRRRSSTIGTPAKTPKSSAASFDTPVRRLSNPKVVQSTPLMRPTGQRRATGMPSPSAGRSLARPASSRPTGLRGPSAGRPSGLRGPLVRPATSRGRKVSVAATATEAEKAARKEYLERNADAIKKIAKDGSDKVKMFREAVRQAKKSGMVKDDSPRAPISTTKSDLMKRLMALRAKEGK